MVKKNGDDHPHDKVETVPEQPVETVIVGDTRYSFGKRVAAVGIALLFLAFLILAYKQSAKNGKDINDQEPVVVPTPKVIITIKPNPPASTTSDIPRQPGVVVITSPGPAGSNGRPGRDAPTPRPAPSSKPRPSASQKPPASPTPKPVRSLVCTIVNCPRSANEQPRTGPASQDLRLSQVGSIGGVASGSYGLYCLVGAAASAKRRRSQRSDHCG